MHKPTTNPGAPWPALSLPKGLASKTWVSRAASLTIIAATVLVLPVRAQLIGEPPIPPKNKIQKTRAAHLEWLWQYSPPPAEGRENDLIQDPHFRPFLDQYLTAPQSFWGPNPTDPKSPVHKSLPEAAYDFLAIPGRVIADDNRYITVTGAVRHRPASRGLLFADLNNPHPLVLFAAIEWTRDDRPTEDPAAEYTLWLFPNQPPGSESKPSSLPPALTRSLSRWIATPLAGSGIQQKITTAILVDPDGTPHQIPVPTAAAAPLTNDAPVLPKRR